MNMKKIAAIAAAAVMAVGICAGVPAGTESGSLLAVTAEAASSDFVIETDSSGNKYVSKYNGNGTNITIPSDVKYIAFNAFANNDTITSITFPKSCVEIKDSAFSGLDTLKTIVFEGNAKIGKTAFRECEKLESVTIKGSIKDCINDGAFNTCTSLKTFKVNKNDYNFYIGNGAFLECHSLTSINIPDKCTHIGDNVFVNCFSLTSLTIPAKTKTGLDSTVGYDAFGDDYTGTYCFGYAAVKATENGEKDFFVADGKRSGYYYHDGNDYSITPKQLTVYVTKGSPAEKYCKDNGIKYAYGSVPVATTQPTTKTTAPTVKKLAAPTGVKGTVSSDKIVLTWNKVDGAEGYRIYKYDEKTGKYLKYKDVKNEKCTVKGLKSNTKYKFKIYALVSEKGKFAVQTPSNAFSFTTKSAKKAAELFDDTLITL